MRKPSQPQQQKKPAINPKSKKGQILIAALYGLYVIGLPLSLMHAKDGTPFCLALFALNLFLAVVSGFLFFSGIHTPDYLVQWLNMPFNRLKTLLIFCPLMILGFVTAYYVYSP